MEHNIGQIVSIIGTAHSKEFETIGCDAIPTPCSMYRDAAFS